MTSSGCESRSPSEPQRGSSSERNGRRRPHPGRRRLGGAPVRARPAAARTRGAAGRAAAGTALRVRGPALEDSGTRAISCAAVAHGPDSTRPALAAGRRDPRDARACPTTQLAASRRRRRRAAERVGHPHRPRPARRRSRCAPTSTSIPAFNQLWQAQGIDMRFEGHTHFVTVGQAIGTPDCPVPDAAGSTGSRPCRRSCSTMARRGRPRGRRCTTVGQLARLRLGRAGRRPLRPEGPLDAAADRPAAPEPSALPPRAGDPPGRARRPRGARTSTAGSCSTRAGRRHARRATTASSSARAAELGIAKSGYVLVALRLVQRPQRLLSRLRPTGSRPGHRLRARSSRPARACSRSATPTSAAAAIEASRADYEHHARAARALAEEHLDSDRVLEPPPRPRCSGDGRRRRLVRDALRDARSRARFGEAAESRCWSGARAPTGRASPSKSSTWSSRTAPAGVMLKDLSRGSLDPRPRAREAAFLHDPLREIEPTASCSTAPGSARRSSTARASTRPRPVLALHRERRGRRAVAGRRARDLGRGGALAGSAAQPLRGAAPSSWDLLLRYDRRLLAAVDRSRRRVRARHGATRLGQPRSASGSCGWRAHMTRSWSASRASRDLHPRRVLPIERAGRPRPGPGVPADRARSTGRSPPSARAWSTWRR